MYQGLTILSRCFNGANFFLSHPQVVWQMTVAFLRLYLSEFSTYFLQGLSRGCFQAIAKLPLCGFSKNQILFSTCVMGHHHAKRSFTDECPYAFSAYLLVVPDTFCHPWSYQGAKSTNQLTHCMTWPTRLIDLGGVS